MDRYQLQEISIKEFEGISLGHAQNKEAGTGVSVLYFEKGAQVGSDISGGGPASRETPLTSPVTAANPVNAIVLSGGSAYGLAASDGVMRCLEEHGIGYDTGVALVPLVCQSCIFDLGYKSASVRPDAAMGYEACLQALKAEGGEVPADGQIGVATGATVGKLMGMDYASKTGLGYYGVQIGEFKMGALVAVNALGDIIDPASGQIISGLKKDGVFPDSRKLLLDMMKPRDLFTGNTTIGAVFCNADFNKAELTKIASMTRNAYARCICPVGTLADGDTIYAAAMGDLKVDINMAGTLAAYVMEQAIMRACRI